MIEVGSLVHWEFTAGGQRCAPKPGRVIDMRNAEYAFRVKGDHFDCWVPLKELEETA